jgi:hypothetical protein
MKELIDPEKLPEAVMVSICSTILNLAKTKPVDALLAYSYFFGDHDYRELSDLIFTDRSRHGPRVISKEGIEWRIANIRKKVREEYNTLTENGIVATEEIRDL